MLRLKIVRSAKVNVLLYWLYEVLKLSGHMVFEFAPNQEFNFMSAFAHHVGASVQVDTLTLPLWLGSGTIQRFRLAPSFIMLIHHYTLNEELMLRRRAVDDTVGRINLLFQNNTSQITTPAAQSTLYFPAKEAIFFIVVSTTQSSLGELLQLKTSNRVVEQILTGEQGFLFYETMSAEAQTLLKTLATAGIQAPLSNFWIWMQVQALLYWFFERLLMRTIERHRPVHPSDARQLERVRAELLADLSSPPQLVQLARLSSMSTSKLTELFRQVFGRSIYEYFQQARMAEAAHLLKQKGYSVSETGHQLGFSNLSHFSRLFAKHHGKTPKRFATDY